MGSLTMVLGGARSGKSHFAERLAARSPAVIYVATGQVTDGEMAERIARHRAERPAHWLTVEEGYHPAAAVAHLLARGGAAGGPAARRAPGPGPAPVTVLLDCVTFLASNHLLQDESGGEAALTRELELLVSLEADVIAVANEVGMGLVPEYPLGRRFRDMAGRANQFLAARAQHVYMCWAGIPVDIKRLAAEVSDA